LHLPPLRGRCRREGELDGAAANPLSILAAHAWRYAVGPVVRPRRNTDNHLRYSCAWLSLSMPFGGVQDD
jgi:hypothetical protein